MSIGCIMRWRDGKLVYHEEHGRVVYREPEAKKKRSANIISDCAEKPIYSHADGKVYDSKSTYRREAKARGYEEVGNERPKPKARTKEIDWSTAIKETLEGRGRAN